MKKTIISLLLVTGSTFLSLQALAQKYSAKTTAPDGKAVIAADKDQKKTPAADANKPVPPTDKIPVTGNKLSQDAAKTTAVDQSVGQTTPAFSDQAARGIKMAPTEYKVAPSLAPTAVQQQQPVPVAEKAKKKDL
jgi:hypothetical protein